MIANYEAPLNWGLTYDKFFKNLPKDKVSVTKVGNVRVGSYAQLHNFPGDCGALLLTAAGLVKDNDLDLVKEIASQNGFSKVIATIAKYSCHAKQNKELLDMYRKAGWRCVSKSKSNRNSTKTSWVMLLTVDCKYKGY